ncbi:MAG TPA: peptidyl-prolyl cis-trans isomerase [Caulobacterales bacterium]|nr:peptidyl-prolyl cis-trans isomerase [Caulobacterales bacterium]
MGVDRQKLRFVSVAGALALGLTLGGLAGCGLGRGPDTGQGPGISNPVVAATVNGRPIYVEDVRTYAVQRGLLQEGQDLDANSDAFYFALEELIQFRLFAMEAEARGLDREPDVHRRLENARERVLAAAIYDEIDQRANDPQAIERLYRENAGRLGQGQEVHLRHIQFQSKEAADAAKRRLDQGERFEALAFEVSTDRATAADGGDMGFVQVGDLAQPIRDLEERTSVGQVAGPVQVGDTWHLLRVEDRREKGAPSLEELRPRIIQWLRFQEISELQDRLERNARIERVREREQGAEPGGEVSEPAAGPPTAQSAPGASAPDATAPPGQHAPPAFPFPMGPGGVYGSSNPPATTTAAPGPAATTTAAPTQEPPH